MKPLVLAISLAAAGCGATGSDPVQAPAGGAAPVPAEVSATDAAPTDAAPPPRASQTVVQATAGTTALDVGQVLEIALEGSAGTGYAWQLEADGSPQLRPVPVPPSPEAAESDGPRVVGGPTAQRWHFLAERAGEATVKLSYRRSWESGAPAREVVFGVVVNEVAAP